MPRVLVDSTELEQLKTQNAANKSEIDRLQKLAKTPGSATGLTPGQVMANVDTDGRITSYWQRTDDEVKFDISPTKGIARKAYLERRDQAKQQIKSAGYVPWGTFKNAGEFIKEGLANHQHSSFREKHATHMKAVSAVEKAIAGMSETVGADGGYTVLPEFAPGIMDRVFANQLWSKTDNYTVSGNNMTFHANAETSRATGSRHGGLRGYWVGEGNTITASKPGLRQVARKLNKLAVVVYLTQELLDDTSEALEQYVGRKAAEEFEFLIGDSLVNGTGAGQPLGYMNWPSLISIAKEAGQPASTIMTENVLKMYGRFFMPSLSGASWYHNQDILQQLYQMTLAVGTGGVVTYMPPGGVSGSPYANLMGRPMEPIEFAATLGTSGDLGLVDFGSMLSISKGGVAQAVSMHVQFLTDQLALRFTMRLDAGPWWNAALTPFKGNNTQSTAVVLDTRA